MLLVAIDILVDTFYIDIVVIIGFSSNNSIIDIKRVCHKSVTHPLFSLH